MKNKIFKTSIILVMILTMTMTNFIFVGNSLISYALDDGNSTNHNNIEFNTYFKNEKGEKVASLDTTASNKDATLYLYLNVKQEGYLNGSISLKNGANFKLVASDHQYVEKVENNTIKLYNITAGTSIEIPVKIEPVKEETYQVGLLDVESEISLSGIYKDSSQKDKKINATKSVKLNLVDEITQEDIINEVSIITNKVSNVNGEEKRVVQLSWNIGTKSNSYPIQEITANINAPVIEGKEPQIEKQVNLNTMTAYDSHYENGINQITLTNQKTEQGTITWKTSGTENIILTYLYDKDVNLEDIAIKTEVNMLLHNQKEIKHNSQITLDKEEKDAVVEVTTQNQENAIYKGKPMAGIDRQYLTKTAVKVNLAKMVKEIIVQENESTYTVGESENQANIFYQQTLIAKEQFDKLLGENGVITIINQADQVIGTIDAKTEVNENGYMVINYEENQTKAIRIQTTEPITEGTLEMNHIKNIKETQKETVKAASRIHTIIAYQYNQGIINQVENTIPLQDTVTESKITIDTNQLSTVVNNHVEMKVTLLSNGEKYDLYENPNLMITLPSQVENINITNISKLYDDNNEFGDTIQYAIQNNQINLVLNGKQTNYTTAVEGITIVIEADVKVSKTAATSEEQIVMNYQNANALTYANDAVANAPIKITAPREITTVNSIHDLSVETIGEEEKTEVMMEKGTVAKRMKADMEIINSNTAAIQDVKILGDFPTDNSESNMGIAITEGIQVAGVENAKVYYSENENPTDDITDAQNGWSENLETAQPKTYLILLDTIDSQSSVQANYQMTIPENLAYNQVASEGYSINATNSETGMETKLASTRIAMQTGVGPKVEVELHASVGADELKENAVVKNGEVIRYQIKVSNTGTEDATNIAVVGQVPEGTTLVEPMEHYEYTGSAYYQEKAESKTYTAKMDSLKVGESAVAEYEVRVNKDVSAGTAIKNEIELQYGEAKTTSSITNVTETSNVRASLKRITDKTDSIYKGDYIEYYAIIENMSNAEQKDVMIQTNLSDNAEVVEIGVLTGIPVQNITDKDLAEITPTQKPNSNSTNDYNAEEHVTGTQEDDDEEDVLNENYQKLTYQKEINIGNIASGETKVVYYRVKTKEAEKMSMSVIAKASQQTSRSNLWNDTTLYYSIKANMTTNTDSQFVGTGDEIEYHITVENTGTGEDFFRIVDEIPNDLEIKSIVVDGQEKSIPEDSNKVEIYKVLKAQTVTNITITAKVGYHENANVKTITNLATVEDDGGEKVATTSEITHIIKSYEEEGDNSNNNNNTNNNNGEGNSNSGNNNNNNNSNQNTAQGNNMIAGVAWLDLDSDGVKETGESLLPNITVKLLNVETNEIVKNGEGNDITATTNEEGIYILQNIANGKYIVIFEYDNTKYGLTTYQVSGASESENSNAVMNDLTIDGTTTKVASTDIIIVEDANIANINIGLIQLKDFDLQLEKYVSQILIQNASGSTVRKYDNANMAKVELDAKKVNGSTILVEYNIKVSNVGEVDGYAKKIVDYMPSDLKFSSELNKDWYQTNGMLYNASLANDKIAAGDSKTITLTLTKAMTENNTGLTTNVAEIAEDYNELGISDSNSTPGNKAEGENDMSSADVIISIRTGGMLYLSIFIVMVAVSGAIAFIILKRKKQMHKGIL